VLLKTGMTPESDLVGSGMKAVVRALQSSPMPTVTPSPSTSRAWHRSTSTSCPRQRRRPRT